MIFQSLQKLILFIFVLSMLVPSSIVHSESKRGGGFIKRYRHFKQFSQNSDRKQGIHSGNLIRTIFSNYGTIGEPYGQPNAEWPKGSGHNYIFEFGIIVGAEVIDTSGNTIHILSEGIVGSHLANAGGDIAPDGTIWGFEPTAGYAAEGQDYIAMSDNQNTWPDYWPDKDEDWTGVWNGEYGKGLVRADQESYYVMNDYSNAEFSFFPNSTDSTMRGLGLEITARGYQWAHNLAEDCIFLIYEVTNTSTTDYDKVVFGMYGDADVGGAEDWYDDDSWFDIENDIVYVWDHDGVGNWGGEPGYFGYKFLESPGNALDGIDNDGDGESYGTGFVISQSDLDSISYSPGSAIVLIDYFSELYVRTVTYMPEDSVVVQGLRGDVVVYPNNNIIEISDNGMDDNLNGLIDENSFHIGLLAKNWITGEGIDNLLIDERRDDGIDNDADWDPDRDDVGADGVEAIDVNGDGDFNDPNDIEPDTGEDDGIPTAGEPFFDDKDISESDQIGLTSFKAFVWPELIVNDDEQMWEAFLPGFFPQPPQTIDFVCGYGSGYFPLKAGQTERISIALLLGEDEADILRNAETVQKIYDNNYSFSKAPDKPNLTAIPGDGRVMLYWDNNAESSRDPVTGLDFEGYKIYKATDPGFNEIRTITDGYGNPTYFSPEIQFDYNNNIDGFFPLEDGLGVKYYLGDNTGLQHSWEDPNVINGQTYFYAVVSYDRGDSLLGITPAECTKNIGIDVAGNRQTDINTVEIIPRAPSPGWSPGGLSGSITHTAGHGTGDISLVVLNPDAVKESESFTIVFDDTSSEYLTYFLFRGAQMEPIFLNSSFTNGEDSNPVFDGLRLFVNNHTEILLDEAQSGWTSGDCNYEYLFQVWDSNDPIPPLTYEFRFSDAIADSDDVYQHPVPFVIWNITEDHRSRFVLLDNDQNDTWSSGDEIIILQGDSGISLTAWAVTFIAPNNDIINEPEDGDVMLLHTTKPFASDDVFTFTTMGSIPADKNIENNYINDIAVIPNPYVATAIWEPDHNFIMGRGERRIYFINLPSEATIRIFDIRGRLVKTMRHYEPGTGSIRAWDLLSEDGLSVAFGIYIYHVETPLGNEMTGKFALIK